MSRFFRFCLSLTWLWLAGCTAVHHKSTKIPRYENPYWNGCDETVPAKPDGYQHFSCADKQNQRFEVLVKAEKR